MSYGIKFFRLRHIYGFLSRYITHVNSRFRDLSILDCGQKSRTEITGVVVRDGSYTNECNHLTQEPRLVSPGIVILYIMHYEYVYGVIMDMRRYVHLVLHWRKVQLNELPTSLPDFVSLLEGERGSSSIYSHTRHHI